MKHMYISAVVAAAALLPLQPYWPSVLIFVSDRWNGWAVLWVALVAFFLLYNFRVLKFFLRPVPWQAVTAAALVAAVIAMAPASLGNPTLVAAYISIPLLFIIFPAVPLQLRTVIPYCLIGIAVLYAQWGLAQFVIQRDIGMTLLGESQIEAHLPGVAKFESIGGIKLIRAYGPFAHANIFGGFMALALLVTMMQYRRSGAARRVRYWYLSMYAILLIGLAVSFSRSALLAVVLATLFYLIGTSRMFRVNLTRFGAVAFVLLVAFVPFGIARLTDPHDAAVAERLTGYRIAMNTIYSRPLIGVGIGNYTSTLVGIDSLEPWEKEAPVHNALLLLVAEWGVPLAALGALWFAFGVPHWPLSSLVAFVILLLFDHYIVTQEAMVIWSSIYYVISRQK